MEIKTLQEVAGYYVKYSPDSSARLFNGKLRANLITLLCQSETVEAVGTVEVFGGEQDVAGNMAKAILNVFCIAEVLGVDLPSALEKTLTATYAKISAPAHPEVGNDEAGKGNDTSKDAEMPPADDKKSVTDKPVAGSHSESGEAAQSGTAAIGAGTSADDPKSKKIATYKKSFQDAKDTADIKKVWSTIVSDKDLMSPDRFALQSDKEGAEKRVAIAK